MNNPFDPFLGYLFACAALMVSGLSPLAVVFYQSRLAKANTLRQDKTAKTLLDSNAEVADAAAHANADTAAALGKIHTLVNSNLTEAQDRELDATRLMLASMREVVELKEDRGIPVNNDTLEAIEIAEERIRDLAQLIAHKQQQQQLADVIKGPPPNSP